MTYKTKRKKQKHRKKNNTSTKLARRKQRTRTNTPQPMISQREKAPHLTIRYGQRRKNFIITILKKKIPRGILRSTNGPRLNQIQRTTIHNNRQIQRSIHNPPNRNNMRRSRRNYRHKRIQRNTPKPNSRHNRFKRKHPRMLPQSRSFNP